MTSAHSAVLPYPPAVNNLYATVNGRRVLSKRGREFKEQAAWAARLAGMAPSDSSVEVTVKVYRPRRTGDLDNVLKATLDALTGVAWIDDSQVSTIHAYRFEDKHNPRVEIAVRALGIEEGESK